MVVVPVRLVLFALALTLFAFAPAWASSGPRPELVEAARVALRKHADRVAKSDIIAIIDYALPSRHPRLFVIDAQTGRTESFLVAHGRGSDPDFDGIATRFSNKAESKTSSLGAYVTGAPYLGAHGLSLKLIGLDATNDKAEARAIVLHGANYVSPRHKVLGRSWGCPAVELRYVKKLVERLKGGALLYVGR